MLPQAGKLILEETDNSGNRKKGNIPGTKKALHQ